MNKRWAVESTRLLFERDRHRVRLDTCRTPSGVEVKDYLVREVNDIAMVFAVTPVEQVVLVRQYRHGIGEDTLELPQGLFEDGESSLEAGARELLEETGYVAPGLEPLGTLYASPAVQTNHVHLLLGRDATDRGVTSPDPEEDLDVVLVPLRELGDLVGRGDVRAASSVAGILLALRALAGGGVGAVDPTRPAGAR